MQLESVFIHLLTAEGQRLQRMAAYKFQNVIFLKFVHIFILTKILLQN